MNKKIHLVFLFFTVLYSAFVSSHDKISLQTTNNPPFNMSLAGKTYSKEDGIQGAVTEVLQEVFKRAGVPYQMTLRTPWKRGYDKALTRKGYGVFSADLTEEQKPLFKWVGPLVRNEWVILVSGKSKVKISTIADLKKYKVGSLNGSAITRHLITNGIEPITVPTDTRNAVKLARGKIDAWAVGYLPGLYHSVSKGLPMPKREFILAARTMYLALNKETDDATVQKLQAALDAMKEDGSYKEAFNRNLSAMRLRN